MADATTTVATLKQIAQSFAAARQWEPYHSPKNLVMALATEVAELMEHFLWLDAEQSRLACGDPSKREAIADELADVVYLTMLFSIHSGLDIHDSVTAKMVKNEKKYPVNQTSE
ncbi:MAG: nucleotide pyrophosphohydrolase [Gemmataceae bacterium]|jgi:NTP pyrophosphatase (non-canonical NTP hydrolase)|nr:nucleotide pyrophosphohydrolase [Gemmataceae bacterium]